MRKVELVLTNYVLGSWLSFLKTKMLCCPKIKCSVSICTNHFILGNWEISRRPCREVDTGFFTSLASNIVAQKRTVELWELSHEEC